MEKMLQPYLVSTYYLSATCHCLESTPNSLAAIKCSINYGPRYCCCFIILIMLQTQWGPRQETRWPSEHRHTALCCCCWGIKHLEAKHSRPRPRPRPQLWLALWGTLPSRVLLSSLWMTHQGLLVASCRDGPCSWMSVLCCQADSGDLHPLATFTRPSQVSELSCL